MASRRKDPSGYFTFRAEVNGHVERLRQLQRGEAAERIADALAIVDSPSEWLGEVAVAMNAALSEPSLPQDLRAGIERSVERVREGFRRVGGEPNF